MTFFALQPAVTRDDRLAATAAKTLVVSHQAAASISLGDDDKRPSLHIKQALSCAWLLMPFCAVANFPHAWDDAQAFRRAFLLH